MHRRRKALVAVILILCLLAGGGYLIYRNTVKDYVDCARMLAKVYNADRSDLSFVVTLDTAGQSIDSHFRAIRFPFQGGTATQVTVKGIKNDYVFYKINGQNLQEAQTEESQEGIPRNFMELIQWARDIYRSDLEIRKIRDRTNTIYTVEVPDEMVQSFMNTYLGKLQIFDLKYTDCKLILTGNGRTMTELALQGTAEYRVLFVNSSTDVIVRARVNAIGNSVQIPEIPDHVVKAAN